MMLHPEYYAIINKTSGKEKIFLPNMFNQAEMKTLITKSDNNYLLQDFCFEDDTCVVLESF